MSDITDLAPSMSTPPEDAAQNISNANMFDIHPTYAAQNKDLYDEKANVSRAPAYAEQPVDDYMRQSDQHASLAKDDVDHLNWFARQGRMIGDYFYERPNVNNDIIDLTMKKINHGGNLSADDEIKLTDANQKAADMAQKNYNLDGPLNEIPSWIAEAVSNQGRSWARGLYKGMTEGPFKHRPMLNLIYGTGIKEPFDQLTAGSYNTLSSMTDDSGKPLNLDHETKLGISRGVGVVGTIIMNGTGYAVGETVPFVKAFVNPNLVGQIASNPTRAAIVSAIGNGFKGAIATGGAAGAVEMTNIIGEEMGKGEAKNEPGFWNALGNVANKLSTGQQVEVIDDFGKPDEVPKSHYETGYPLWKRIGEATAKGAVVGGAIETGLQIAGFGYTKQRFKQGYSEYLQNLPPDRDVTPGGPGNPQLPPGPSDIGVGGEFGGNGGGGAPNEPLALPPGQQERMANLLDALQEKSGEEDAAQSAKRQEVLEKLFNGPRPPRNLKEFIDAIGQAKDRDLQKKMQDLIDQGVQNKRDEIKKNNNVLNSKGNKETTSIKDLHNAFQDILSKQHIEKNDSVIDITPNNDGGGEEHPMETAIKTLQMHEALQRMNDVQGATKMSELSPEQLDDVNKRSMEAAGLDKFYVDPEDIKNWADNEKKGYAARMLIGTPENVAKYRTNTPIEVPGYKVMAIERQYKDLLPHIQYKPGGPNAITAAKHVEAMQRAEDQRAGVMGKLGVEHQDAFQPPAQQDTGDITNIPDSPEPQQQKERPGLSSKQKTKVEFAEAPPPTDTIDGFLDRMGIKRAEKNALAEVAPQINDIREQIQSKDAEIKDLEAQHEKTTDARDRSAIQERIRLKHEAIDKLTDQAQDLREKAFKPDVEPTIADHAQKVNDLLTEKKQLTQEIHNPNIENMKDVTPKESTGPMSRDEAIATTKRVEEINKQIKENLDHDSKGDIEEFGKKIDERKNLYDEKDALDKKLDTQFRPSHQQKLKEISKLEDKLADPELNDLQKQKVKNKIKEHEKGLTFEEPKDNEKPNEQPAPHQEYAQKFKELTDEKTALQEKVAEETAKPTEKPTEIPRPGEEPKVSPKAQALQDQIAGVDQKINDLKAAHPNNSRIAEIDEELIYVKKAVADQYEQHPPGSVLSFPYEEHAWAKKFELRFGFEPTFGDALSTVVPKDQMDRFNSAVLTARQNTVELIHDQAVHEMNKVVDQHVEIAKDQQYRDEIDRIAHDPNFATVDKFRQYQIGNAKGQNQRSIYSIDPESLPPELRYFYDEKQRVPADDAEALTPNAEISYPSEVGHILFPNVGEQPGVPSPAFRLKEHKVFAQGGNHVDDVARALGFTSPKELLETLAKTPTRDQVVKARAKVYNSQIEKLANEHVDLDHTSILKSFSQKTKAYHETMRFLKDNDWSATKLGIKKISLPLPPIEEIEHSSREAVKKMTIGSLEEAPWVIGERKSYREAVNKFLDGDIAGAFVAKEKAMRNAAIRREVLKALAQVNRAQKFARRLEEPTAQQIVKDAGKLYEKALNEILDVYNFNPNKKNQSEQDSFNKWVKRMFAKGEGDFHIPDQFTDVRQSIDEMTVEQVLVSENALRNVFKMAQLKTKLLTARLRKDEEEYLDRVAARVNQLAKAHRSYGEGNEPPVQDTSSINKNVQMKFQTGFSLTTNMEHSVRFYDREQKNGFFQTLLVHPLKGDGEFNFKSGGSKEHKFIEWLSDNMKNIMKAHGDYDSVEKKILTIPEFKNFKSLNNGFLTKGDLMVYWGYKGDPDGREKLKNNFQDRDGNFIPLDTWQKVFDKYLDDRDVSAQQHSIDLFKQYRKDTKELQERDKGEEVVFIEGIPNQHRGKWYPGGYVPLKYVSEFSAKAAEQALAELDEKKAAWFEKQSIGSKIARQHAAEQTEQGRLKERTGSDSPLDGSLLRFWRGHEEIIHDLSYREPIKDALKILKDKRIREAMIKMGGEPRFNVVLNTVIEMAGQIQRDNANYFSDQNRIVKSAYSFLQNRFNILYLGANIFTSTPIQATALAQAWLNMGGWGFEYIARTINLFSANPFMWRKFGELAKEIDPTIAHSIDDIKGQVASQIRHLLPKKKKLAFEFQGEMINIPSVPFVTKFYEWFISGIMFPMEFMDGRVKVIVALAAYQQFMAGKSNDWPIEKVLNLPEMERHNQAIAYARQISRLSLTHARPEDKTPFQKSPRAELFANYLNDARNVGANAVSASRRTKWHTQDKEYVKAARLATGLVLIATMTRMYEDKLRGLQETPDQWGYTISDLKDPKKASEISTKMFSYMIASVPDQMATTVPFFKDVFFAEQYPDKHSRGQVDRTKTVQLPLLKSMSDFATSGKIISDTLSQTDGLADFFHTLGNLKNSETKTLMFAGSMIFPLPVNSYSHMMRLLDLPLNEPTRIPEAAVDKLKSAMEAFQERQKGPHKIGDLPPEFEAEVQKILDRLKPHVAQIPPKFDSVLKIAMSGADWTQPNGIYGFTKEKWDDVRKRAPELGLTENGRMAGNLDQQEKAADWLNHQNMEFLSHHDIPVNETTLYGAFLFGPNKYEALYNAKPSEKTEDILGKDFLEKNPEFSYFETVGALKSDLENTIKNASASTNPNAKLTSPTGNNEDKL